MSAFSHVELVPNDPILGLTEAFRDDSRDQKVNLGVGAYKSAEGKSHVLSCVRKAEAQVVEQQLPKDYLPIDGDSEFRRLLFEVVFGGKHEVLENNRTATVQTLGGTGGLRVGFELLNDQGFGPVYLSNPSWANHAAICRRIGVSPKSYRYYDSDSHRLDFEGMCADISAMPKGSVVLLQASCHNPTGIDPTPDQWRELSTIIKKQGVFPFFDLAYQGFGDGLEEDAFSIRHFAEEGHEMALAVSCSKNFGLYGERVGALAIVAADRDTALRVSSQCKQVVRGQYSMPPLHGARIVRTILSSEALTTEWQAELSAMRQRITEMRQALVTGLQARANGHDFSFLADQKGMFSFSGLEKGQVAQMKESNGIYMPGSGRVNVAGLTVPVIDYVADAITAAISQ